MCQFILIMTSANLQIDGSKPSCVYYSVISTKMFDLTLIQIQVQGLL